MKTKSAARLLATGLGALALTSAGAASAQAAPITMGGPLSGTWTRTSAEAQTYLVTPTAYPGGFGRVSSPVDGVILHWSLREGSGSFELGVLEPTGSEYTLNRLSGPVSPASSTGVETFATDLPIAAGEAIGLEVAPGGTEAVEFGIGGTSDGWEPAPAIGPTGPPLHLNGIYGFNAEVLPAPTVTALGATSGPTSGGTSVTISGTDFTQVGRVAFGSTAASNYTVDSEGQITAIAPAGTGEVPVSVTTVAGTATSTQRFSYVAPAPIASPLPAPTPVTPATCKVPNLKGRTLKAAKKRIRAADCRVGRLTKREGATAKDGSVVGQMPRPGATVPAETKVRVTLAP